MEFSVINWLFVIKFDLVVNGNLKILQNAAILKYAKFRQEQFNLHFKDVDEDKYQKTSVIRQLKQVKEMGASLLEEKDLEELNSSKQKMAVTYNSARICPFEKQNCNLATEGMTLDPEIELKMAESSNYEELKWIWSEWHKESGAKMRTEYKVSHWKLINLMKNFKI